MKKLLLVFVMLFACMCLSAQDVIVKKSGTVINCRIISADSSAVIVKYNIDGYMVDGSINREEIKEILFNYKSTAVPPAVEKASADDDDDPFRQETKFYVSGGFALPMLKGDARIYADAIYEDMQIYPRLFPLELSIGFETRIKKNYSFMGGLEYARKGIMFLGQSSTNEQRLWYNIKIDYIEMPLCIQYSPEGWMRKDYSGYFINAGIAPAYRVTSKWKVKGVNGSGKATEVGDFEGTVDYDFNLLVGLGYRFSYMYALEMTYEQGSCNVMEEDFAPLTFYNRSLMFNFTISF